MRSLRERIRLTRIISTLVIVFLFASFSASSSPQKTGEKVNTNFDILKKVSSRAIEEILANMPKIDKSSRIRLIKSRSVGEIDFVFENTLLQTLTARGFKITDKNPGQDEVSKAEEADYELDYQIVRMSLTYPDIGRSWLIGAKEVERYAEIHLFTQLMDSASGDIIWIGETEKRYSDVIPYSALEKVEDPEYAFTRPERNEFSWGKLVQPVIVTGIVSGLVYLFFSNQSNE